MHLAPWRGGERRILVSSILIESSGGGAQVGGNIRSSVFARLNFKKCCDIQTGMSVSRLVTCKESLNFK